MKSKSETYPLATAAWARRYRVSKPTIRRWRARGFALGDDVLLHDQLWAYLRRPPPWCEDFTPKMAGEKLTDAEMEAFILRCRELAREKTKVRGEDETDDE